MAESEREANRVRVTAADFNGHDWDGSPFDPVPAPAWLMAAFDAGDIKPSNKHATDYAVWDVAGAGEAWPGDHIIRTGERQFRIDPHPSNKDVRR